MDSVLYDALIKDNIDVLEEMERRLSVRKHKTYQNCSVLHLACQYGSIKCVEHILSAHESLLIRNNFRGETVVHLAARGGHCDVVVALLTAAKSSLLKPKPIQNTSLSLVQFLIRKSNVEHETALHAAVPYNHKEVVQLLVIEDPSHSHPRNKNNETPLYLASIRCNPDVIRTILDNCEYPQFGGPNGRTALHAALLDDGGLECVKLLLEKNKDLIKIGDKYGWTAFHYAAYNDLYHVVEDLVGAGKHLGYLGDNQIDKRTALHVAAYQGNVRVMKKLVEYYPDSWAITEKNDRNILHIAVRHDHKEVIRFILTQGCTARNILFIQKDSEGNTPLHLIAKFGCYVEELMDLRELDWEVLNSSGHTPLDVLHNSGQARNLANQAMVKTTLIKAKAKRQNLWLQDLESRIMAENRVEQQEAETIEKWINTHIIVAILITTVALTAGFAMPGGFDGNKGTTKGSPLLLRKTAFQIFMVTDAIALLLSISSLFLYFMTIMVKGLKIAETLFITSTMLNLSSIMAMMLAFISGTWAVLAHSLALAIGVCVICFLFFPLVIYFGFFIRVIKS